jgi:chlorobactene glucosyltransferase
MAFPFDPLSLPWLMPLAALPIISRKHPRLVDEPEAAGRMVSVIIPARNESGTIDRLLSSLRRTTYAPVEFILVDDTSTDDTAAIAERHAAEDPRIRVVRGAQLPDGWYGKAWACVQGYRAARADLLLFTDADTVHGPGALAHAVGALERSGADLVTVLTRQELVSFWERAVMPQILTLLLFRYRPAQLNRATRGRDVIANGQFILVRRDAYESAGTHESVRDGVAEDLLLAQRFLEAGKRLRAWWAEDLITTRMYTGLGAMLEGWSKNIYLGGRATFPEEPILRRLVPVALVAGPAFWLLPLVALFFGAAWAPAAIALSVAFWTLIVLGLKLPPMYGLVYPLGAVMTLVMVLRSLARGERRVVWRGREYSGVERPTGEGRRATGDSREATGSDIEA